MGTEAIGSHFLSHREAPTTIQVIFLSHHLSALKKKLLALSWSHSEVHWSHFNHLKLFEKKSIAITAVVLTKIWFKEYLDVIYVPRAIVHLYVLWHTKLERRGTSLWNGLSWTKTNHIGQLLLCNCFYHSHIQKFYSSPF